MAFVQRLRHSYTAFPSKCREFRPVFCQLRWRSTTAISSTIDEKSQPKLARDMVLDFDDPKQAFKSKTTWEIVRALAVFKICSIDLIVKNNKMVSFGRCHLTQLHIDGYQRNSINTCSSVFYSVSSFTQTDFSGMQCLFFLYSLVQASFHLR